LSKFAETGLPCPCGASSDAYSIDHDGDGFCFGQCGGRYFKNKEEDEIILSEEEVLEKELTPKGKETYGFQENYRGIYKRTQEFYGVHTKFIDGTPFSLAYVYPNESLKIRILPKKFYATGPIGEAHLFGENLFSPGSYDSVTIVEGEDDALSAFQMLWSRNAVVSVKNASTALGDVKARREYLNAFKKIILCLDNDKAGQEATRLITNSGLFDYEKVYRVTLSRHKDAHAYLEAGEVEDFIRAWDTAKRYTPDAVINSFEDIEEALKAKSDGPIGSWPFAELNDCLIGLHKSEFILIKGLEKIGKTEVCRAIVHEFLRNSPDINIATIFLEESTSTTIKGVATYELETPCALQQSGVSDEDILNGYKKALRGDSSRLYIHTHFSTEDEGELIDNIRFLVTVAGCKLVLLDNLTMLTTGREDEDERLRIDRIIRRLRDLVNELDFCLVLVAHVNDNGQTRGSRLPDKLANTIVHLERNKMAANVQERNSLKFFIEGARAQGTKTGPAGFAFFDPITFKLRDVKPEDEIVLPEVE